MQEGLILSHQESLFIAPSNPCFSVAVLVDDDSDDDREGVGPHSSNLQAVVVGLHHHAHYL